MNVFLTISDAKALDSKDALRPLRKKFYLPKWKGEDSIYLSGNSLGPQPKNTKKALLQELKDWEELGVAGHFKANKPWFSYHEYFNKSLSRLTGSKETEVICMGSLTANLHFALASFYRPTKKRKIILCEKKAFPSDRYALISKLKMHNLTESELLEVHGSDSTGVPNDEDILKAISIHGDSISLVLIGGVNYYTGRLYDMKRITKAAKEKGITVGWDLAHAIGNVPLNLNKWNIDFAVWCSYKYLNSGPGGTAGMFIHENHHKSDLPKLAGWWGHNKATRFKMGDEFDPIKTAESWQVSNAPVLSMSALRASLDIFDSVPLESLRNKSLALSQCIMQMIDHLSEESGEKIKIITPREDAKRGGQVSVQFENRNNSFFQQISKNGVIADWREPGTIRMAIAPLYNSYEDISKLEKALKDSIET